jgi:hypothetical protein
VLRSETYKYNKITDADSPTRQESKKRCARQAKQNARIKFDPAAHEKAKAKRRKVQLAVPEAPPAVHTDLLPTAPAQPAQGTQASAGSTGASDKVVARDWALLRAYKRLGDAAAVLDFLRDSGHVAQPIDDDELWTPETVAARRRMLCEVVRLAHRLVGSSQEPLKRMKELHALCA